MTEYEKMLSGEIYNAVDPSLLKDLYACSELCWEYNQTRLTDLKARNEKLKQILGEVQVTIGAGSVVVKDIPSHSIAVGNPCVVIKDLED